MRVGFIGQGWIGKNYANDFEDRGFDVVRYGLEPEYIGNKEKLKECGVVFIAVPTPTTSQGFDCTIVDESLRLLHDGSIAIIKSTILPGTTETLQEKYPNIFVVHSPEFLRETHAEYDARHPARNIVGIPKDNKSFQDVAEKVLAILPKSPYNKIMHSREAELVKYIGNCYLYQKVVFFNQMYDLANALNLNYQNIRDAVVKDERIGDTHTHVNHASGHNSQFLGRGAGGHCFIKDFEALIEMYEKKMPNDVLGLNSLKSIRDKNHELLINSKKDVDLLMKVIKPKLE